MKTCVYLLLIGIITALLSVHSVSAMDEPGFSIGRMVASGSIIDREPTRVAETFPAATEQVYCFLEATDIEEDTEITFVWLYNEKEMSRVTLPLKKGPRWRTYSSKKLAGMKGQWKVELLSIDGIVFNAISFIVE